MREALEFLPCPFCGSTNIIYATDDKLIRCNECRAKSCCGNEKQATQFWNTRASPSAADAGAEAAQKHALIEWYEAAADIELSDKMADRYRLTANLLRATPSPQPAALPSREETVNIIAEAMRYGAEVSRLADYADRQKRMWSAAQGFADRLLASRSASVTGEYERGYAACYEQWRPVIEAHGDASLARLEAALSRPSEANPQQPAEYDAELNAFQRGVDFAHDTMPQQPAVAMGRDAFARRLFYAYSRTSESWDELVDSRKAVWLSEADTFLADFCRPSPAALDAGTVEACARVAEDYEVPEAQGAEYQSGVIDTAHFIAESIRALKAPS